MLYIIIIVFAFMIGGYFAFRYFTVLHAFRQIIKELNEIQQDLTRNQILHLPMPDRYLGKLLASFNRILEDIRKERQNYEKREKELQRQIENISHDLRTPLTVILGYLKLVKKSGRQQMNWDNELTETIDTIERKAEVMKNLVTQFYDFSRLNAGDYNITLDNMDVSRTLRESMMGNYQILEQAHLQVDLDIPHHPIWVVGEESALERIFLNLLQNARRYAASFLHVSIEERDTVTVISFMNDTRLLSEDDVPHLFDRFYMQDSSRNRGGTGLGLTVARSLAQEMGAVLAVSVLDKESISPETDGLTICFTLSMQPSKNYF